MHGTQTRMIHWLLNIDDRIATLTLNRPDTRNAITPDALHELRAISRELGADDAVWAIVVQGAGDNFSVGVDVSAIGGMIQQNPADFGPFLRDLQDCMDTFEAIPKPTIAKIRGYCVGGGVILALCCDFRLAAESARFSLPEVKRGIAVLMGTGRITRAIGLARTKELTLLGGVIDAPTALDYGLLTRVFPDNELDTQADAFAAQFRSLPPRTIAIAKQIADASTHLSLAENQAMEIDLQSTLLNSGDLAEGVKSFFEKRPPNFTGC